VTGIQWGLIVGFPATIVILGALLRPLFWQGSKGRHRR
jgi:hypothetical protein